MLHRIDFDGFSEFVNYNNIMNMDALMHILCLNKLILIAVLFGFYLF